VTQNTKEIALDEAGNTGADLLNPQQPTFALASVSLSRDEAGEVLQDLRTDQTKELKFSRLKTSESGRRRVIRFLSSPELTGDNSKVSFVHKKFMVTGKIVDLLIGNLLHMTGTDMHKDGSHIALSNLHFFCMSTFCGQDWTDTFLKRFVEMFRERTPRSIQSFYHAAWTLHAVSKSQKYADLLIPILASEKIIESVIANSNKNTLDPAIPTFFQHCTFWGNIFGGAFDLIHDESKPLFQEKKTLEDQMSRGEEERVIGYGSRKFIFPLRVTKMKFGRSVDDPRLQAADLVAGAGAFWVNGYISPPSDKKFWEAIEATGIRRFILGVIWPDQNIIQEKASTEDATGVNAADYIADFLSKHRK
jgi:hypothetical protein